MSQRRSRESTVPTPLSSSQIRVPSYSNFDSASATASHAKRSNRRDGGRAERLLRKLLWQRGLRFRVHVRGLPGEPDIVFPRQRLCVFCDGDFWHGRDWPTLRMRLETRANPGYWIPKIARNIQRDAERTDALQRRGWSVLRLWETEILHDPDRATSAIAAAIGRASAQDSGSRPVT